MAKFHAQIRQFRKLARISEITARRSKISSSSTLCGRKRVHVYVQLLELLPFAKFHDQICKVEKSARICLELWSMANNGHGGSQAERQGELNPGLFR